MINKNKFFRLVHIYMSLFFLPVALLYAITGIAYIFGADQDTGMKEQRFEKFVVLNAGKQREEVLEILKELNIKIPSKTELKADKRENAFIMGGTHYSISIKQNPQKLVIISKERSILGDMIMLHKDKGEWYFAVLGVGFGVALMILYLSGLFITMFASKKDRGKQISVLVAGCVITLLLMYLSL